MTRRLDAEIKKFEHRQFIFSGLILLALLLTSMVLNTLHLNAVAEQNAKVISRLIQANDLREVSLTLEDTRLSHFTEIHFTSTAPDRSLDLPFDSILHQTSPFIKWLTTERTTVPLMNPLDSDRHDEITYVYSRFRFVPHAMIIWFLLMLVSIPQTRLMKQKVVKEFDSELIVARDRAQATVAKEVRHNLRSPLAALMRIPGRLPDSIKQDRDLLISTINQIRALVSRLGHEGESLSENYSPEIYDSLMQSIQEIAIIIPSHIQFIHEIDEAIVSAHIKHIPHELRALLCNIVGNAIEAINGDGTIVLRAKDLEENLEIEISDSGGGIPTKIVDRVFDDKFTYGKAKGTGTGLYHAKRWIETWHGTIEAGRSTDGMTTFTIRLPVEDRAVWYVPRIRLAEDQSVLVVDDHESARDLWELRLDEAGVSNAKVLSTIDDFRSAFNKHERSNLLPPALFFDYDLRDKSTGLDLLAEVKGISEKYLVTGHFDDPEIRKRCAREGVKLLPKSQLPDISIMVI